MQGLQCPCWFYKSIAHSFSKEMSLSVGIFDYDKWARMPEKTLSAPPSRKKLAVLAEKKWSHVPNSKAF